MEILSLGSFSLPESVPKHGQASGPSVFMEFFVNQQPLSKQLTTFYRMEETILVNLVGVLGSGGSKPADRLTIKQLLGKAITDTEIRQLYPAEWTDEKVSYYIDAYKEEMAREEPLIYVCRACGDPGCGGIRVQIRKTGYGVQWTFRDNENQLAFTFEKDAYYNLFKQPKY